MFERRNPERILIPDGPDTGRVRRNGDACASLPEALADAQPGDVVTLGPGRYADGPFPLEVPAGVTLRAEADLAARSAVIDGCGDSVIDLANGAVLEDLVVTGAGSGYPFVPPTCITARDADAVVVRRCAVAAISISGGTSHRIEANVISGGNVVLDGVTNALVAANFQHGSGWGVGIEVVGGNDVTIEHNECHDDLCAIRIAGSVGARVERNRIQARWFAIHIRDANAAIVRRNRIAHTMRAVSVEGGRDNVVERNLVEGCDTGVQLEGGSVATEVGENWLHGCRVGILAWDGRGVVLTGNAISESREHAVVANAPLETAGNDLGGGSVWIAPPRA